ncbi:ABC transporter substrate-binding protein [Streptomyces odontomachi]|uniref:ABC transporter substrate-binding protein n=1 Tax=Streptomyces odontomachi TaxID=2944940 RepID=UPI00210B9D8E|nr:ABC transporter substrate-binding protein [Streptomyces sp. ODS25]
MTGRRSRRSSLLSALSRLPRRTGTPALRPLRTGAALALCAALTAACGALPGDRGSEAPIKVMTWAPENTTATNKPGMPALARAYARWADSEGGLGDHPLTVLTCNDHNSSAGAAACARRAVKEKVVAVVGSYSQYGNSFIPPLEGAGIPYIGGFGLTDEEFSSSVSYPVNGGQPALLAGNGHQLGSGCSKVALVRPDTIAGDSLPPLLDAGLRAKRHDPAADIRVPEDANEYSAMAGQSLSRATDGGVADGGCVSVALGDRTDTFFDSFRRTRDSYPKVRVGSVLGSVDQSVLDRTGGAHSPYEGAYITGWYPVATDAKWHTMRRVIRTHAFGDNRIDPSDAGVQTTWIAYTVLRKAVESLGDQPVTGNSLRHAFDNGLRVGTDGLTPTLSWRFEDLLAAEDYPRAINTDVTFQQVKGGRLVAEREGFVNVSATLESADS